MANPVYSELRHGWNLLANTISSWTGTRVNFCGVKKSASEAKLTNLKGAVIASTQAAVDNNKNTFTAGGTLTTSDIQNSASFNGSAAGISVDVGTQPGKLGVNGVGVGTLRL